MKKTIKFICDFITSQREDLASLREKEVADLSVAIPKAVLLTCPYPLRFIAGTEKLFVVSSYGGAIAGNEATLDYAINTLEVPILLVLAHEDCSALQGALKGTGNTQVEQQLFAKIAPAFALYLYLIIQIFMPDITFPIPLWVLAIGAQALFIVYDFIYSYCITFYEKNIRPKVNSFNNRR